MPEGAKFMVMAPVVRGRKGEYGKLFDELRGEGFTRVKVDGELRRLEEDIVLDKKYKHDISVVIDRLVMRPDLRKRLADSIETAVARAEGIVDIEDVTREGRARRRSSEREEVTTYSERFMCLHCGTSMPELEPRMFSFNSPHGACSRCTGLGSQMEIDPDLIVPDPSLSLNEGAILPWSTSASSYYEQMTQAIADKWEVDQDAAWEDLPRTFATASFTARTARSSTSPTATATGASAPTPPPSRESSPASSAATARRTRTGRARRSRST